jgi:PhnB protein
MAAKSKAIPGGYHTATPYLVVTNAGKASEFYKEAFGATECMRLASPDGKVMHAEIKIGDSPIMMPDENPEWGSLSPQTIDCWTPLGGRSQLEDTRSDSGP